jgi:predicted TIM-barrel fold metal-dependent hydrolase
VNKHRRIDVHQHLLPPDYLAALRDKGIDAAGGMPLPKWSAEGALAVMDANSIASAILSVSAPGTHFGDDAEALALARSCNEFCAELAEKHPDRFRYFATLALPDVAGSVREATHALDHLDANGIILLANSLGTYLGHPDLDPLMAELDARGTVVFVHPAALPGPAAEGIPPFAADFLLDTTRAAYNLVRHGIPRRFPNITFILSHAGGFVPYAAHRLALSVGAATARDPADVLTDFAGFYFDTALSASPTALPSLLAFAKPGHILFGSDTPFAPDSIVSYFTQGLDASDLLDDQQRHDINRGSAELLFPTLSASRDR